MIMEASMGLRRSELGACGAQTALKTHLLKKGEKRLACGFYRRTFMKKKTYLEFQTNGKAFDADSVQEKIKEELKAEKIVLKKISELNIYINADEDTAYYIAKDADGNELANSSIDVAE